MKILKGYKFRLEPSEVQSADMFLFAGHNRAVWNKSLALTKDRLVKAKDGLNKSIRDAGWSMFAQMLEYKQLWSGGNVEYVPAAYTSQCCSKCQHTAKENRVSQSKFKCVECGYEANADYNAALNILARWRQDIAVPACGVTALAETVKQEPLAV